MEWISVQDKLPDNKDTPYILATYKGSLPFIVCYGVWGNYFTVVGGGPKSIVREITHWMPLPEPPSI